MFVTAVHTEYLKGKHFHCTACGWTGPGREAIMEPHTVVKCPKCTQPVDIDTKEPTR